MDQGFGPVGLLLYVASQCRSGRHFRWVNDINTHSPIPFNHVKTDSISRLMNRHESGLSPACPRATTPIRRDTNGLPRQSSDNTYFMMNGCKYYDPAHGGHACGACLCQALPYHSEWSTPRHTAQAQGVWESQSMMNGANARCVAQQRTSISPDSSRILGCGMSVRILRFATFLRNTAKRDALRSRGERKLKALRGLGKPSLHAEGIGRGLQEVWNGAGTGRSLRQGKGKIAGDCLTQLER